MLKLGHLLTCSSVPQAPLCCHIYKHTLWPFVICNWRAHSIQLEQPHSLLSCPPSPAFFKFLKQPKLWQQMKGGGLITSLKLPVHFFHEEKLLVREIQAWKVGKGFSFLGVNYYAITLGVFILDAGVLLCFFAL